MKALEGQPWSNVAGEITRLEATINRLLSNSGGALGPKVQVERSNTFRITAEIPQSVLIPVSEWPAEAAPLREEYLLAKHTPWSDKVRLAIGKGRKYVPLSSTCLYEHTVRKAKGPDFSLLFAVDLAKRESMRFYHFERGGVETSKKVDMLLECTVDLAFPDREAFIRRVYPGHTAKRFLFDFASGDVVLPETLGYSNRMSNVDVLSALPDLIGDHRSYVNARK